MSKGTFHVEHSEYRECHCCGVTIRKGEIHAAPYDDNTTHVFCSQACVEQVENIHALAGIE